MKAAIRIAADTTSSCLKLQSLRNMASQREIHRSASPKQSTSYFGDKVITLVIGKAET